MASRLPMRARHIAHLALAVRVEFAKALAVQIHETDRTSAVVVKLSVRLRVCAIDRLIVHKKLSQTIVFAHR